METGKDLVHKQLFRADAFRKYLWSFHISDKPENGIIDILIIPALSEGVDDLSDTAPAKEVAADVLIDKSSDTV